MTVETVQKFLPIDVIKCGKNPRKVSATKEADTQLLKSITRIGLINPITVAPDPKNPDHYVVVAGNRRFKAAKKIGMKLVPSTIMNSHWDSVALDENTQRASMHPADEMVAFKAAIDDGSTPKSIANQYGITEKTVYQRLSLANLIPEAIEAWQKDELDLSAVKALTTGTCEQQKQVISSEMRTGWEIRRFLQKGGVSSDSRLGQFAGEDYEDLGHPSTKDLFEDVSIYHNVDLLTEVAAEKLRNISKKKFPDTEVIVQIDGFEIPKGYKRGPKDLTAPDMTIATISYEGETVLIPLVCNEEEESVSEDTSIISKAHKLEIERIKRESWINAVASGRIDDKRIAALIIRQGLGSKRVEEPSSGIVEGSMLKGSELRRAYNPNHEKRSPDFSGMSVTQLITAHFLDINASSRADEWFTGFRFRQWWTPEADFFKRMTAENIKTVIKFLMGIDQIDALGSLGLLSGKAPVTKGQWADFAADLFSGHYNEKLSKEQIARIEDWEPS